MLSTSTDKWHVCITMLLHPEVVRVLDCAAPEITWNNPELRMIY